jgi:hypothetical protein
LFDQPMFRLGIGVRRQHIVTCATESVPGGREPARGLIRLTRLGRRELTLRSRNPASTGRPAGRPGREEEH